MGTFHVVEMFHGATGAFKDLALSILGALLDYFLEKDKRHAVVLQFALASFVFSMIRLCRSLWGPLGILAQQRFMR